MGDGSLASEVLQLVRGLSASFALKVSHICSYFLQHKNLGALAGLAIAFVCTWKLLKVPGSPSGRIDKREDGTPTQEQNKTSQNLELTVAKTVKRQLMGAKKASCQLLGVVLEETTPEELRKHATVRTSVIDVLLELARTCDLYLFAKVCDDESEGAVMTALEAAGVFESGHFNRNKVLFYDTDLGSNSFVRQLEPEWHIDTSVHRVEQLARFVRHQLVIRSSQETSSTGLPPNVFLADSLEGHFGVPSN